MEVWKSRAWKSRRLEVLRKSRSLEVRRKTGSPKVWKKSGSPEVRRELGSLEVRNIFMIATCFEVWKSGSPEGFFDRYMCLLTSWGSVYPTGTAMYAADNGVNFGEAAEAAKPCQVVPSIL